MYICPRRIKCSNAYSNSIMTKKGVLVGRPVAMGLLLLANLDSVDRFWSSLPQQIKNSLVAFKVYVDDFIIAF